MTLTPTLTQDVDDKKQTIRPDGITKPKQITTKQQWCRDERNTQAKQKHVLSSKDRPSFPSKSNSCSSGSLRNFIIVGVGF
jgi:hypothetical protein